MMKKTIITLGLMLSYSCANATLSCENMSQEVFGKILVEYKNNFELNHFTNPEKDFSDEDKKYINNAKYSANEIKKCQYILDLNKYDINSDKRYRALVKLKNFVLTANEQNLYNLRVQESVLQHQAYSNVSVVSSEVKRYPLVYMSVAKAPHAVLLYEFRLQNNRVERYAVVTTNGITAPLKSGSRNEQILFLSYLNQRYNTKFQVPVQNELEQITQNIKKNIQKSRIERSNKRVLKADIKGTKTFKKYDGKVWQTDILKGSTIEYLHQRKNSTDYVILYNHKKWTISEKQWHTSTGGQ